MAESKSSGSTSVGKASLAVGSLGGREITDLSNLKGFNLAQFMEEHTKIPQYEITRKKPIYDKAPMESNYRIPSYGREAIGIYSSQAVSRSYKPIGKDVFMTNISYKQASKYNLN